MTSAVATLVAGVLRSSTIGPISTGSALMLNDIWICARTMTIKGSQGDLSASCALEVSAGTVKASSMNSAHARCASESRAKLVYLLRILPQPILDQPVHRPLCKRPVRCPFAGCVPHQQLDSFVDVADRPDVKTSRPHGFDDFVLQHQVLHVCRRHHHALLARQSPFAADIV